MIAGHDDAVADDADALSDRLRLKIVSNSQFLETELYQYQTNIYIYKYTFKMPFSSLLNHCQNVS